MFERPEKKTSGKVQENTKANKTVVRIYSSTTFKECEKCKQVMISGYIRRADIATASQTNPRAAG
jgi:hypothetical protein